MPELGAKYECHSCGALFYDLGRSVPTCPKCGADPRDAKKPEMATESFHAKRKRRDEPARGAVEEEESAPAGGEVEVSDEELVHPEAVDGEHAEVEEEEDLDDEA